MKTFTEYMKLKENLHNDPTMSRDFLGYHASRYNDPPGVVDPEYGQHFRELLDNMTNQYRDYALQQGWLDMDIEANDETAKEISRWLRSENIGMIFVSHDKPYDSNRRGGASYGHNAFYVMLPEKDRLSQILDPGEIDASIVLYHRNQPPKFIPIE